MKRRASSTPMDSLELLLDTICNTFGAVIFISMLVAVLVAQSRTPTPPVEESSATVVDEIQQKERLAALQRQQRQQDLIRDQLVDDSAADAARQIQMLQPQLNALQQQNSADAAALRVAQQEAQSSQQKLSEEERAMLAAQQKNDTLKQKVLRLEKLQARTARIPAVRRTSKESVVFALQDGKLYRVTTPDQRIDAVDCQRAVENNLEVIRPRRAAGLVVENAAAADIAGKLKGLKGGKHFAQIFVSPNSFAAFLPLKDAVVSQGLEYEVKVSETDRVELFLGASRQESFVQ